MTKGPLPRRDGRGHSSIPTQYGPDNPVAAPDAPPRPPRPRAGGFRVRPGVPEPPEPEPQRVPPQGTRTTPAPAAPAETTGSYPIRPGLPSDPPEPTPDWSARADAYADERRRRRTRRRVLLTAVAVLAVGGAAAGIAAAGGHSTSPTAAGPASPAASTTPAAAPMPAAPTGPAADSPALPSPALTPSQTLLDPVTALSDAATDTAPLSPAALFPQRTPTVHGHAYTRVLTDRQPCDHAVTAQLAPVLAHNGCQAVYRASYTTGGVATTVGIAVFPDSAKATAVKQAAATGNLESLFGGPLKPFCRGTACRLSTNAVGRYVYFTVSGFRTDKPVPTKDRTALTAGTDLAQLAFDTLITRGDTESR